MSCDTIVHIISLNCIFILSNSGGQHSSSFTYTCSVIRTTWNGTHYASLFFWVYFGLTHLKVTLILSLLLQILSIFSDMSGYMKLLGIW